jgi:ABC-type transport system involved in multi-copper enzyme maturation permease subunit/ABC-type uncharacterized transport system involved in gliding motility auxiliary subunit
MKNALTIMRRDLGAYFTSPVGYIFIIVFLLISVGLYVTSFFAFPMADMRGYFSNLPLMLCIFIPAVTMRVWAEERKENTWELLLTFPMKAWELVIGKFLASLTFFAITLAATITVPIMLVSLGNPDNGALFGGYFGTLLLGAFFLSVGIFFSGFCKDQIVAFVVTLLMCFAIFLVGTNFIASHIDGVFPGMGAALMQLVGMIEHYNAFTRGVLEFADILYFLTWTVLFLGLNILYVDGRNRAGAKSTFATASAICIGIGLAFNWLIADTSLGRFDLTEDKIYTVSPATERILSKVPGTVEMNVYISPKDDLPTAMAQLQRDVTDKLDELRVASSGKVSFTVVPMRASNVISDQPAFGAEEEEEPADEEEAIEKRMLDKGVQPFTVQAMGAGEFTNKLVYSSIGVGYRDQKEEIIPQVMPDGMGGTPLSELEYRLVSTIYKLTREEAPVVALVAPKESINIPPQQRAIMQQLGQPIPTEDDPYEYLEQILNVEKYTVERVGLTQDSPLPEEFDTLVVVNPRELSDRQRWEINRVVVSGKPVILAVQDYGWNYRVVRNQLNIQRRDESPGVNELLDHYGLGLNPDILMDVNQVPLMIGDAMSQMFGGGMSLQYGTHMLVSSDSMNQDTSITNRLATLFYLWGSALKVDEEKLQQLGLEQQVLMTSTDDAWTIPIDTPLDQDLLTEGPAEGRGQHPLMVQLTGQFPDAFADQPRPAWPTPQPTPGQPPPPPPAPEAEATSVPPAPGKLIVLGCSEMFRKNFMQAGNLDLFLNSVDAVSLGDDIVNVRGRKPIDRMIKKPSKGQQTFWKTVNYAGVSTLVAIFGIALTVQRRRARNAYTMAHQND